MRADRLLAEVAKHARILARKQEGLERTAKEERIAYNLLLSRGYPASSPECSRLVKRQKGFQTAISRVSGALSQAQRMESRLHEVVDQTDAGSTEVRIPAQLRADVRAYLARYRSSLGPEPLIPDEQWGAGNDALMTLGSSVNTRAGRQAGAAPGKGERGF